MNQVIIAGNASNFVRYTTKDGRRAYIIFDLTSIEKGKTLKIKCYCDINNNKVSDVVMKLESTSEKTSPVVTVVGSLRMKETSKCTSYSVQVKKII